MNIDFEPNQNQFEAQAKEAQRQLANIWSALDQSAIVVVTDKNGKITQVNDKFCEISKFSRHELIGKTHAIVNSGYHSAAFFTDMWSTISSGKRWEGEIRNRARDGSYYWVHTNIVPIRDSSGSIESYVAIRFDITEKKESENNTRNLLEASPDGHIIYDLEGKILWSNKIAAGLFDVNPTDIIGRLVPSLFQDKIDLFIPKPQNLTLSINDKNIFLETLTKQYYFQGHRCFLLFLRDVTERANLEAQILQQDRLTTIGMLSSGLAHEIGTPLGVIRARAELITMQIKNEENSLAGLKIIIEQIDRIAALVKSLLGLARGSGETKAVEVSPAKVLSDVLIFLGHELRKNQIQVEMNLNQNTKVMAVGTSLFQVFLNLLINAIHAINEKVSSEQIDKTIVLQAKIEITEVDRDKFVEIRIKDNGIGISEENLRKIFKPFFTTKQIGIGTGLGLATTNQMIHSWGGGLSVSSVVNLGTEIVISLRKPEASNL